MSDLDQGSDLNQGDQAAVISDKLRGEHRHVSWEPCLRRCSELGQALGQILRPLAERLGLHARLDRAPLELRQLPLGRLQRRTGFRRVGAGLLQSLRSVTIA